MAIIARIAGYADELTDIRRDFHAHPEIGFEEVRTSTIVAGLLEGWGIEVHRGVGLTGVVGIIRGDGRSGATVGLRADMDALPIQETADVAWSSTSPGVMHACGHDGHTTMLLGAARYLAETRDFPGNVICIFQPAEEGLGGARAMIADGLFDRFPCHEIYGLHNSPKGPNSEVAVRFGSAMAAADFFDIRIIGKGSHGAMPQHANDPTVIAVTIAQAMQTIVSRNIDPIRAARRVDHTDSRGLSLQRRPRDGPSGGDGALFRRGRSHAGARAHRRTRTGNRCRVRGAGRGRDP